MVELSMIIKKSIARVIQKETKELPE
jgi:hypothetical protein